MEIHRHNGTLSVTDLDELNAANARTLRTAVAAALSSGAREIEIDLSRLRSIDGTGLAALVSVYETFSLEVSDPGVAIRLINLSSPVQQMIELARLHHLFEIKPRGFERDSAFSTQNASR